MSWGWSYVGKRDAVLAKVRAEKLYPGSGALQMNFYDALIAGLVAQLEKLPADVAVEAKSEGHVNEDGKWSNATSSIRTLNMVE